MPVLWNLIIRGERDHENWSLWSLVFEKLQPPKKISCVHARKFRKFCMQSACYITAILKEPFKYFYIPFPIARKEAPTRVEKHDKEVKTSTPRILRSNRGKLQLSWACTRFIWAEILGSRAPVKYLFWIERVRVLPTLSRFSYLSGYDFSLRVGRESWPVLASNMDLALISVPTNRSV